MRELSRRCLMGPRQKCCTGKREVDGAVLLGRREIDNGWEMAGLLAGESVGRLGRRCPAGKERD